MPVSISYGEYKTVASEFLIPNPCNNGRLLGIKSGNEYLYGTISFIGLEISTNDIITKMLSNGIHIKALDRYTIILNRYIDEIYRYKISNIIESELDDDKNITLKRVANRPLR